MDCGFTRCADGSRLEGNDPPTTETFARVRLRRELLKTGRVVCRLVVCPLTSNQFGALTSFAYNVGSGNFKASTLRQRLNRGDYAGAFFAADFFMAGFGIEDLAPGMS